MIKHHCLPHEAVPRRSAGSFSHGLFIRQAINHG